MTVIVQDFCCPRPNRKCWFNGNWRWPSRIKEGQTGSFTFTAPLVERIDHTLRSGRSG